MDEVGLFFSANTAKCLCEFECILLQTGALEKKIQFSWVYPKKIVIKN